MGNIMENVSVKVTVVQNLLYFSNINMSVWLPKKHLGKSVF